MPSLTSWPPFRRHLRLSAVLGLLATSGCSQIAGACTSDLSTRLTPPAHTLRVGESFTPELVLLGCGGRERLRDTVTWETADANIVAVNAATGRVTALAAGQVPVTATAQYYGVSAVVQVTVAAP